MSEYGILSTEKYGSDQVYQARKAAEQEIALLEAEGNLFREKKEAILAIYQANHQAKELISRAESARMEASTAAILDFVAKYNVYMEHSLEIITLFNQAALDLDTAYSGLIDKTSRDTFEFMTDKIPELLNSLEKLDKNNPLYNQFKESSEKMIANLLAAQEKQLGYLHERQRSLVTDNNSLLKNSLVKLESRVTARLLPLFAEEQQQLAITAKIGMLLENKNV